VGNNFSYPHQLLSSFVFSYLPHGFFPDISVPATHTLFLHMVSDLPNHTSPLDPLSFPNFFPFSRTCCCPSFYRLILKTTLDERDADSPIEGFPPSPPSFVTLLCLTALVLRKRLGIAFRYGPPPPFHDNPKLYGGPAVFFPKVARKMLYVGFEPPIVRDVCPNVASSFSCQIIKMVC